MKISPARELALVAGGFALLTSIVTFPLALHPGSLSHELSNFDGQFSIWNVAWVARALVRDPLHVFDANIFYPHRWTLAYSEANLGAGAVAIPAYWLTKNPYAAHNFALLASFVLSGAGMYYLARYLTGDRRAAAIGAIAFAYCPYAFAHLLHIQLLMTAGLPFSLLAFHRMADRPTPGRGAALGGVMGAQAYFCAYYGVFAMVLIGYAVLFIALSRGLWRHVAYWTAVAAAAAVAIVLIAPLAIVHEVIQRSTDSARSVEAAGSYAATWTYYLVSSSYAHAWMLEYLRGPWRESLFPGFIALGFGLGGVGSRFHFLRTPTTSSGTQKMKTTPDTISLYGSIALLALWESFGPAAGLYRATYAIVPGFSFLRAPSRFGLLVTLALIVLAAIAIAQLLARATRPTLVAVVLAAVAFVEAREPLQLMRARTPDPAYQMLAAQPYGALLELPVYSEQFAFSRAKYMLGSTAHWMPLVDAYSDYIPQDFRDRADVLGEFPTRESLQELARSHVRYAIIHVDTYKPEIREMLEQRLQQFSVYLKPLYSDDSTALFEIVGTP